MQVKPPFYLREFASESCLNLLQKTYLGTNGAKYKHLNTTEIIKQLDNPIFLSLERNQKTLGNITFCKRGTFWYIRYFAFDSIFQSSNAQYKQKNSSLKNQLKDVFNQEENNFYAYIDPKNSRSKFMSEQFGFTKIGNLKTYSFSRLKPKKSNKLIEICDLNELNKLNLRFHDELFYFKPSTSRVKSYVLKNQKDKIIAKASIQKAQWKIERLPGKFGSILVKIIPFIPMLNQFLKPKNHQFLVADEVFFENEKALEKLFESILAKEKFKLLFWWVDEKNNLLKKTAKIKWGIFRLFIGTPKVDVVAKINNNNINLKKTFYVSGMDLI